MPRPSRAARAPQLPAFAIDRSLRAPEQVYRGLRHAIISLAIAPGTALSEGDVAEACSISRTPVREAFARLSEEQLLDVFPNLGTFVSLIDPQTIAEAITIRRLLEGEAAASAAANPDPALLRAMSDTLARHAEAVAEGDAVRAYACDEAFHHLLFAWQQLSQMWQSVSRARTHLQRVHHLRISEHGALGDALEQHRLVLAGIEAGSPEAARTAMAAHIDAHGRFLSRIAGRKHPFIRTA